MHFKGTFDRAAGLKTPLKSLLTEHLLSKAFKNHFEPSISSQFHYKITFEPPFRLKSTLKPFWPSIYTLKSTLEVYLTEHFVSKAL